MPAERFFLEEDLAQPTLCFKNEELHHLKKVMRIREKEEIECINGKGDLARVLIEEIQKKEAWGTVIQHSYTPPSHNQLVLIQGIPRLNRLDTLIEKTTELGVTEIWLFPAERSEKKELSNQQQTRARHLSIAAIKQSGRLHLPTIHIQPPIKKWQAPPFPFYFGDFSPSAPHLLSLPAQQQVGVVIGPESGLSPQELAHLKELQGQGVRLHQNTLRTDTAGIFAVGCLSQMTQLT